MPFTVLPLSLVGVAGRPVSSSTMEFVILPLSLIRAALDPLVGSLSVNCVLLPQAFVNVADIPGHFASAVAAPAKIELPRVLPQCLSLPLQMAVVPARRGRLPRPQRIGRRA